jgi:superkiller protein 3
VRGGLVPAVFLLLAHTAAGSETPASLADRAQQLARNHQFEEAEKLWQQAIHLDPRFFPAQFDLGLFYYNQGQFSKALPLLQTACELRRSDFNAQYLLGAVLSRLGHTDDALRHWREAQRLNPKHVRLLQLMAIEYGKGQYFQEAATVGRAALELDAGDPNLYLIALKALQDAGDTSAGFALAARAAERFPENARANFELGFYLQKQGDMEGAAARLRQAMTLDPSYEEPFFFYGDLLVNQGKNEEAIPYFRNAIRNRPDYVPARVQLARTLMSLKLWDDAVRELELTMAQDPRHPTPHLLLSQLYFRLGDENRAKREKDLSLRLRRENPALLEALQSRPFPER